MRKKPLSINIIALVYFIMPFFTLWRFAYINQWPWTGPRSVIYHLSFLEWGVLALFPIVALGVYRVTKWGYYLFLGFSGFLICHSIMMYIQYPSHGIYLTILGNLAVFGVAGYFLQSHVKAPYFNPNLKWWERSTRFGIKINGQLRLNQTFYECEILDLSEGGCFLEATAKLQLLDLVWVYLSFSQIQLTLLGKVVWIKKQSGTKGGVGLEFITLDSQTTKDLNRVIKILNKSHKAPKVSEQTKSAA